MKLRVYWGIAAVALLAACSSSPSKPTTAARQAAAIEANRKGETYVRHGELDNAARSYAEALRLSQSLEDPEGIAANAINLSIVRQRQARFGDARASLALIHEGGFSQARLAEAALRHALLSSRPRPHYVVTWPARIAATMRRFLPAAMFYRILATRS